MSVKEIPATKEWACDLCGAKETASSRPKYWAQLNFQQDAYDYQGCAVADGSVNRLLCNSCREKVMTAINSVKP